MPNGSLLATEYPSAQEWRSLLDVFSAEAIAHKLLLASVPYVFRNEPLKFALFRRTIAERFDVRPTDVFIVGSALAGRSLKGETIDKQYSSQSDIDTLIISEHLFTSYVMRSFEWIKTVTSSEDRNSPYKAPSLDEDTVKQIGRLSVNASKGIWRPDALPRGAEAREDFFDRFGVASLNVLGLQLSEDTVAKVNGRIARSFDDAVKDLANSLRRLRHELSDIDKATPKSVPQAA